MCVSKFEYTVNDTSLPHSQQRCTKSILWISGCKRQWHTRINVCEVMGKMCTSPNQYVDSCNKSWTHVKKSITTTAWICNDKSQMQFFSHKCEVLHNFTFPICVSYVALNWFVPARGGHCSMTREHFWSIKGCLSFFNPVKMKPWPLPSRHRLRPIGSFSVLTWTLHSGSEPKICGRRQNGESKVAAKGAKIIAMFAAGAV